jgi:putative FmdB family regulatory protein
MPIYDFHCPKCGLQFEVSRQRDKAGEPAICPQDGTESQRVWVPVPSMNARDRSKPEMPPLPVDNDHDHGHSHGPGTHMH